MGPIWVRPRPGPEKGEESRAFAFWSQQRPPAAAGFVSFLSPPPPPPDQPRRCLLRPWNTTRRRDWEANPRHTVLPLSLSLSGGRALCFAFPVCGWSVAWIGMDSTTTTTPKPVCAEEALALLNCAAESSYDRDKCLAALDALRACIAQKVLDCSPSFPISLSRSTIIVFPPISVSSHITRGEGLAKLLIWLW